MQICDSLFVCQFLKRAVVPEYTYVNTIRMASRMYIHALEVNPWVHTYVPKAMFKQNTSFVKNFGRTTRILCRTTQILSDDRKEELVYVL
jgi:hypothetical protein